MSDHVEVVVSIHLPGGSMIRRSVVTPMPPAEPSDELRIASRALSTAAGDVVAALQLPDPEAVDDADEGDTEGAGS